MSEYTATIEWTRAGDAGFVDKRYSRAHEWKFDGGITVPGSASPSSVPAPYSSAAAVDPEEAFVASLSSCHMLWFLVIAANRGFVVDSYIDAAVGTMEKNSEGKLAMTRVVLRPDIRFSGNKRPGAEELDAMHHEAHAECYIANSVKTDVTCEPVRT
jgi:organic hydroperoxide reductase OsmC/OhrA